MIYDLKLVLWMDDYNESFSDEVEQVRLSIQAIQAMDRRFSKIYMTTSSLSNKKEFINKVSNVESLIFEKRGEIEAAGSSYSFFSENPDASFNGISFTSGVKSSRLVNSLTIDIANVDLSDNDMFDDVVSLFIELVKINKPLFACASDLNTIKEYKGYFDRDKELPKHVYWLNYWKNDTLRKLNADNISNKSIQIDNGVFIKTSEVPLDLNEEGQRNKLIEINEYFLRS